MKHEDVYSDTWRNKKDEWLDYIKNGVLRMVFSSVRYTKYMEKTRGFGMKDCVSLPGLSWKNV